VRMDFQLLFLMSFMLHAVGGAGEYNEHQREHGVAEQVTALEYITTSRFWFESLQNWQSEFLAVGAGRAHYLSTPAMVARI